MSTHDKPNSENFVLQFHVLAIPWKIRTPITKSKTFFPGNMGFRPRDWYHWIRLEIPCCLVVFVRPAADLDSDLTKIDFGTPRPKKNKVCPISAGYQVKKQMRRTAL